MEQYLPFKTVGLNMAQILENNKPARLFFFSSQDRRKGYDFYSLSRLKIS